MSTSDAATVSQQEALRYSIEAKQSSFIVQAFSSGFLSAFGHSPRIAIRDFAGLAEFQMRSDNFENLRLNLRIRAKSLSVIDDISEKDRREIERQMNEDVLETSRFPEVVYQCESVATNALGGGLYAVDLHGSLTLHGETHIQPVSARVSVNESTLRASGEFSIRQSDFGIAPVTVAGGAIRLKDELKLTFNIVGRKQEGPPTPP